MIDKNVIVQLAEEKLASSSNYLVSVDVQPGNIIIVEIDNDEAVSIDDCVELSHYIEDHLDRDADDFELEDLEDGTLKKLLEKKRIFIDYRAIGHDYEDDDYAFMKGYFLTDEEWEEVENAEWSIDSKKKAFAVILYSGEYNNYEEAIATGRPITLVKNDFISQSFDFVPMIYMHVADKEIFPEKLSKNVKFYTDFKYVKFDTEVSMEIPFKIKRIFGIVTEVKRIKNFYKEEDAK